VRQPEEHDIEAVDLVELECVEDETGIGAGEARIQICGSDAGLRVGGGDDDLELGMLSGNAQQLSAREPGSADDPDPKHRRMTIRQLA
jgi:hypothetical protein